MEILGSIQSENVVVAERERVQRLMRDFISRLETERPWAVSSVAYKVHFSRPLFGGKVDCLVEFRAGAQESWYARANGQDPWRAFCRAMESLKQVVIEMSLREESNAIAEENRAI